MSVPINKTYRGLVLQVAVPSPLFHCFDYLPPSDYSSAAGKPEIGSRVLVPFAHRKVVGIVTAVHDQSTFTAAQLKTAIALLDEKAVFPKSIYKVLNWAAAYYQHPIGEVFATALPAKLRSGNKTEQEEIIWTASSAVNSPELATLDRAPKQKALYQFVAQNGVINKKDLEDSPHNQALLAQLVKKRLLVKSSRVLNHPPVSAFDGTLSRASTVKLNKEQDLAVSAITEKLDGFSCFLLDGVTGSGKTEVYMRCMAQQLAKAKQCLILVPEIGLTPQTIRRFEDRFNCPVVALHSGLNDGERLRAWERAASGEAGIIIGTRSAVFTPLKNPGLIIVDEEHDSSFKQQDGFRYSARDLAVMRAKQEKSCIILGSATPSLETIFNAGTKKFTHLRLTERAGKAKTASMEIIDVEKLTLSCGFSEHLLHAIERHLGAQNQVLVYINRRGFAPILSCPDCGWIAECENCVAQFTVHSKPPGIRCHHCGTSKQLPRHCPDCNSKNLNTIGLGTQKIERFLEKHFSSTSVIRIDRDSTRNKDSLSTLLKPVNEGKSCILLGTQMLAKGHHFPNITLVAVIDADSGLFSADFRGQEHMAQTISQVAGRAGRAERAGEVIVQTRHSAHSTLQNLQLGNYNELLEQLLDERRLSAMPPFSHLCMIRAESTDSYLALNFLKQVTTKAEQLITRGRYGVELFGPGTSPMEKRAGKFRMQLMLRSKGRGALQSLLQELRLSIVALKPSRKLRWHIDVDPQDLI